MSEEGRRELIARQHRALYGPEGPGFPTHGQFNQESPSGEQPAQGQQPGQGGLRGASPRGMDPFGMPTQSEGGQQQTAEGKTTSPSSHQQGKVPTPPTGDEPTHSRTISKSTTAPVAGSMGPIGSRPSAQHMTGQSMTKRTTSPLPSALTFGYGTADQNNERAASQASNAAQKDTSAPSMGVWGTGSGVWGNKLGASGWS